MKLVGAKNVDSPRVWSNQEQTAQMDGHEKLTAAAWTSYSCLVLKLAYVAQGRIDIAVEVKCLTRHVEEPRSGHTTELNMLGRYLAKNKRCVLTCPLQMSDVSLQLHADSDRAGDLLGSKSTTGGE